MLEINGKEQLSGRREETKVVGIQCGVGRRKERGRQRGLCVFTLPARHNSARCLPAGLLSDPWRHYPCAWFCLKTQPHPACLYSPPMQLCPKSAGQWWSHGLIRNCCVSKNNGANQNSRVHWLKFWTSAEDKEHEWTWPQFCETQIWKIQ